MSDIFPAEPLGSPGNMPPAGPAAPPAAPEAAPARAETWNDKVVTMRSQGATWGEVGQIESEVWDKVKGAGATDAEAASVLGVNPQIATNMANRYAAQAAAAKGPDLAGIAGSLASWGKDAFDTYEAEYKRTNAAADTALSQAGGNPGGKETLDPGDIGGQVLGAVQAGGALFGKVAAATGVTPAINTLFGGSTEALGRAITGDTHEQAVAEGWRDLASTYALNVAPFATHGLGGIPPAVAEEYVASGLQPRNFLEGQRAAIIRAVGKDTPLTAEHESAIISKLDALAPQRFVDGAISVAGPGASHDAITRAQAGLQRHALETGEAPDVAAVRASQDAHFRQQLISGAVNEPRPPAGSSRTALAGSTSQFVIPKQPTPPGTAWEMADRADRLLPTQANNAVHDWTMQGSASALNDAFAANPTPAGAAIRDQLRAAAQPIRDQLRAEHGPILNLYRVAGDTGNVTSFTPDLATAIKLAGGDPEEVVTERVPVGDVAWATSRWDKEILVHTGKDGKPYSLSERAAPSDTLAHTPTAKPRVAPKPTAKPAPMEASKDPRLTLMAVRASPREWIADKLGVPAQNVHIISGDRPGSVAPGTHRLDEHSTNSAWDYHVDGMTTEESSLALAKALREKGIPFDQSLIEGGGRGSHIGFRADGVGNRSEIRYLYGAKPGDAAHGIALSGDPAALPEGSTAEPEDEAPKEDFAAEAEAERAGLASTELPPKEEEAGPPERAVHVDFEAVHDYENGEKLDNPTRVSDADVHDLVTRAARAAEIKDGDWELTQGVGGYQGSGNPNFTFHTDDPAKAKIVSDILGKALNQNGMSIRSSVAHEGSKLEWVITGDLSRGTTGDSAQALGSRINDAGLGEGHSTDLDGRKMRLFQIGKGNTKASVTAKLNQLAEQFPELTGLKAGRENISMTKPGELPTPELAALTKELATSTASKFFASEHGGIPLGEKAAEALRTADTDHVASMMDGPPQPAKWLDKLSNWWDNVYTGIFEPDHALMKLTRMAQEGGIMEAEPSRLAMQLKRALEYAPSKARYNLDTAMTDLDGNVLGKSLLKILEPFKAERGTDTFKTYAFAKQAVEYGIKGLKHPVDLVTASRVVQAGAEKYEAAFQELVQFQNHTLDWLADPRVGLDSAERVAQWKQDHPNYIPAQRVMEGSKGGVSTGRGMSAFDPIRTAKGSLRPVEDIFHQIARQTVQRRILATEAWAGNAIGQLAQDVGILTKSDDRQLVKITMSHDEMDRFEIYLDDDTDITLARMFKTQLKDGEFPTFENGVMTKLSLPRGLDPAMTRLGTGLIRSLKGADDATLRIIKTIMTPLRVPVGILKGAISLPPSFSARILQYDIPLQGVTNTGVATTATENIFRVVADGLTNVFGGTALKDEASRVGLLTDAVDRLSNEAYFRDRLDIKDPSMMNGVWNAIGTGTGVVPLYKLLRNFRAAMGQVVPTGIYAAAKRAALKSGTALDIPKTGYNMSEGVFHRPGAGGPFGRTVNSMAFPFVAYSRMLENTTRALLPGLPKFEDGKFVGFGPATKPGMAAVSKKIVYGWGAVMTAATLTNWAMNKDQEWYKALPNWQKDKLLFAHIGPDWTKTGEQDANGNDVYTQHGVTVPIWEWTPVMSTIFSAIPRRIAEGLFEKDPTAADGIGATLASSLAPPGMVGGTALLPVIEAIANHSFLTGQPLISDTDRKQHSTPEQLTPYTSGVAHAAAQLVGHVPLLDGIAPWQIDHVMKSWTGNVGQVALQELDVLAQKTRLEPPSKLPTPNASEVLTKLVGGSAFQQYQPGANTQQMHDYWDVQTRVDQAHGDIIQAMKDDDFARFSRLVDANPVAATIERASMRGVAQPKDPDQYEAKLEEAQGKVDADKVEAYETAELAAKAELKALKFIESLPINASASHVAPADVMDVEPGTGLTNDDKRQLMVAYGTTAAVLAEQGTKAARALGLK